MVKNGVDEDVSELLLEGPWQSDGALAGVLAWGRWRQRRSNGGWGDRPGFHPGGQAALQQQGVSATAVDQGPACLHDLGAQLFVTYLPGFSAWSSQVRGGWR